MALSSWLPSVCTHIPSLLWEAFVYECAMCSLLVVLLTWVCALWVLVVVDLTWEPFSPLPSTEALSCRGSSCLLWGWGFWPPTWWRLENGFTRLLWGGGFCPLAKTSSCYISFYLFLGKGLFSGLGVILSIMVAIRLRASWNLPIIPWSSCQATGALWSWAAASCC